MKKSTRFNLNSQVLPPTRLNLCTITFSLLAAMPAAQAASATWSATPTDGLWSTEANWDATPVPGVGDTATFGASTITTIDTGTISLTQIAVTTTTGYTIGTSAGTGQITFADGTTTALSNPGQTNTTINANIILGTAEASNTSFASGVNRTTTLAGSITGGTGGTAAAKVLTLAPTSNANSVVTVSGAISDGGATSLAISKGGIGTVNLTNANNSFTGGLTVGQGQVNVSSVGALGSATTGLIILGTGNLSATLNFTGSPGNVSRQVQIGTAIGNQVTIANNAPNGSTPLIFTNPTFNFQANSSATTRTLLLAGANTDANEVQGVIRNNGNTSLVAVTKADAGTWTLSGGTTGNTYTGATQVNGGILVFGKTLAKASGTVTAAAAGSVGLGVGGAGYYSATDVGNLFNATLTGFTLDAASGVAIDTTAGNFDQNVALTAARALTKLGANTLTLSQTNTYTGATQVNGGILVFGKTAAKAGGTVTAAAAGSVGLGVGGAGYYSATDVGNLFNATLSGFGLNAASGVAIDTTEGDFDQNVALTAARSLTKLGPNTLTLSQTNSYSGATNINAGKLVVNGNISTSSLTTVAVGATLGGSGTVGKTIVNGTLAVGNSPGKMDFTDTLGLNGSTVMEIDGTAGIGVTNGHDLVNLTGVGSAGVLTYGGAMTLDMGVTFAAGTYSWDLFDMASETGTFTTISLADQYSGSLLDTDLNEVWDLTSGDNTWKFTESTGVLGLTVVPEPRAALLGGLGLLALLRRRRI